MIPVRPACCAWLESLPALPDNKPGDGERLARGASLATVRRRRLARRRGERRRRDTCRSGKGEMSVHSLTRFEPGAAPLRAVLRSALRLSRRLASQPGFEALQLFQADAEPGAFLALTRWDGWENHDRGWS